MVDTIKFAREISPDVEVIENKSHWIRDVVLEEDASQVRWSVIPQVMNTLRSTALAALRLINRKTRTIVNSKNKQTLKVVGTRRVP